MRIIIAIAIAMLAGTVLSIAVGAAEFPGAEWTRATPADVNLDAAKLEAARQRVAPYAPSS